MGTNYYIKKPVGETCEHCGRSDKYEEFHIGKSSAGRRFLFNPQLYSFKDVKRILELSPDRIFDEYGSNISLYELYTKISSKQKSPPRDSGYCYLDEEGYEFSYYTDFS